MIVVPDERMTRQIWNDLEEARRGADLSVELIPARAGGFAEWRHEVGTL